MMNWADVSILGLVAVIALGALVFGKRIRTVVSETIKHPLKTTEIKLDEGGKVLEIKVSDGIGLTDRTTARRQAPQRD
jgi:hypothetical protein